MQCYFTACLQQQGYNNMAGSYPNQMNPGSFVPTTSAWEISQIQSVDVNSKQFKELLVRLYQNLNTIALSLNTRDAGYYALEEFINGQIYFPNPSLTSSTPQTPAFRQVFRMVVDFGALPNAGSKSVAHNIDITAQFSFTRIYGASSDQVGFNYIPIPNVSATIPVEIHITLTEVVITTTANLTAYTKTYIVLEYLKQ